MAILVQGIEEENTKEYIRIDIEHSMIDRRRRMLGRPIVCQRRLGMGGLICSETPSSYLGEVSAVH